MRRAVILCSLLFSITMASQPMQNIKILIVTGGHEFEREPFFCMFESMDGIEFTSVEQPEANNIYATTMLDDYDVIVYYDMTQEISEEQKKAFLSMLEKGKGLVFLHHSLVSYQSWEEFEKIQGGRYLLNQQDESKNSTYRHDIEMNVIVLDHQHPVTKGIKNFKILDEVYGNYLVLPNVTPLLKTDHPESGEIIGWANKYGAAKIVFLQMGHDHHAYENENYKTLVLQAIKWAAEH